MSPTEAQFNELKQFSSASWAIWSETFDHDDCDEGDANRFSQFLLRNLANLKCETVFLGLNKSSGAAGHFFPFHNFHTMRHAGDRRLNKYIQTYGLTNLVGSFMTDINSRIVDANGSRVNADQDDFQIFIRQLTVLDSPRFRIICFGPKVFNILAQFFNLQQSHAVELPHGILQLHTRYNDTDFQLIRVWHYTNRGFNYLKVQQLAAQLCSLN